MMMVEGSGELHGGKRGVMREARERAAFENSKVASQQDIWLREGTFFAGCCQFSPRYGEIVNSFEMKPLKQGGGWWWLQGRRLIAHRANSSAIMNNYPVFYSLLPAGLSLCTAC